VPFAHHHKILVCHEFKSYEQAIHPSADFESVTVGLDQLCRMLPNWCFLPWPLPLPLALSIE